MAEREFNFTKRRAERAREKRTTEEKEKQIQEKLSREAELLKEAISHHFSQGEFTATKHGASVRVVRKGTGKTAVIKVQGDGQYSVKSESDLSFKISGMGEEHDLIGGKMVDEKGMIDWVEDWSKA